MTKKALKGKKKRMYEAMRSQLGIVTTAAEQTGISRTIHYEWLKKDPNYKQWIEEIDDITLDFAENALLKQMKNGNTQAIMFYLKTKGKKRDFVEQQNVKTEHSGTIGITKINIVMPNE